MCKNIVEKEKLVFPDIAPIELPFYGNWPISRIKAVDIYLLDSLWKEGKEDSHE